MDDIFECRNPKSFIIINRIQWDSAMYTRIYVIFKESRRMNKFPLEKEQDNVILINLS